MKSGYVQPLLLYEYGDEDEKPKNIVSEIIDGQHRALSIQAFKTGDPAFEEHHTFVVESWQIQRKFSSCHAFPVRVRSGRCGVGGFESTSAPIRVAATDTV